MSRYLALAAPTKSIVPTSDRSERNRRAAVRLTHGKSPGTSELVAVAAGSFRSPISRANLRYCASVRAFLTQNLSMCAKLMSVSRLRLESAKLGEFTRGNRQRAAGKHRYRDAPVLSRLRHECHRAARAARRSRWLETGPSPRPVCHVGDGTSLEYTLPQERRYRGRGAQELSPPRRRLRLRHPRPHGAGLQPPLPARRWPRKLRFGRRRWCGGDAIHRSASDRDL